MKINFLGGTDALRAAVQHQLGWTVHVPQHGQVVGF